MSTIHSDSIPTDSLRDEDHAQAVYEQISREVDQQADRHLRKAIEYLQAKHADLEDLSLEDVALRCRSLRMPDGTEHFTYGSESLVSFGPLEVERPDEKHMRFRRSLQLHYLASPQAPTQTHGNESTASDQP